MVLELHVWGPAFSLPSIDAQCLATIAYFRKAVPQDQWLLIATHSPGQIPIRQLPAVRDGDTWIGGFCGIINHVRQRSAAECDLDAERSIQERATCAAFSTFVEANGQPLLDLALFVSTENYTAVTRPAYSAFLPWPAHFMIPSKQRAAAKIRSDHLGLSALDLDNVGEGKGNTRGEPTNPIPRSLLSRPKETVTSLLSRPQHASQIRLNALTTAFLEPLTNLLAGKRYLLSEDHPTSLDCLVFGYLAIGVYSKLPLSWLADAISAKAGELLDFIHENRREFVGAPIDVHKAFQIDQDEASADQPEMDNAARGPDKDQLPWHVSERFGLPEVGNLLLEEVLTSMPVVRYIHGAIHSQARVINDDSTEKGVAPPEVIRSHYKGMNIAPLSVAVTGLSVAIGYLLYSGIVSHGSEEKEDLGSSNLSDFGEAGATLAVFADDREKRSMA